MAGISCIFRYISQTNKNMKKATLNFYSDGSHGWVKTPKTLLVQLGIENQISGASYMKSEFAYLEEDQDATLLIESAKLKGVEIKIRECSGNGEKRSKIRGYASYEIITPDMEKYMDNIRIEMYKMGNWGPNARKKIANAEKRQLEYWNEYYKMGL